ncbi:SGNH hydrolase-type esterase domain-containing protein [Cladochytrium replicatum]|nr:SGNH hydrolase-type esterase domain-containing protein [Cladochytrium replicatum]
MHILCLGDSLTEGYTKYGMFYHPYSDTLSQLLKSHNIKSSITNAGLSGDRVLDGRMLPRLSSHLHRSRFDLIIVMGGINDLASPKVTPAQLFDGLEKLWRMGLDHDPSAKVLALSLLPVDEEVWDDVAGKRERVNELLRSYFEDGGGGGADPAGRLLFYDIASDIPYERYAGSTSNTIDGGNPRLWDDEVHLTKVGYEKMGTLIFNEIMRCKIGL